MSTLKTYITEQFKVLKTVSIVVLFSVVLLTARIKLTHSFFYLFLVLNLWLAFIPFMISSYLWYTKPHKLKLLFSAAIWLLFLPNAPYIITDLWHLRLANQNLIWLDILIIFSFACSGLLLYYISINTMRDIGKQYVGKTTLNIGFNLLPFVCSFGIYLGRFLRYNSWEIVSNPSALLIDIFNIITQPQVHSKAWWFTISFGCFLWIGNMAFKPIQNKNFKN